MNLAGSRTNQLRTMLQYVGIRPDQTEGSESKIRESGSGYVRTSDIVARVSIFPPFPLSPRPTVGFCCQDGPPGICVNGSPHHH
jgi:hypothetical protein